MRCAVLRCPGFDESGRYAKLSSSGEVLSGVQLEGSGVSLYDFGCGSERVLFASEANILSLNSHGRINAAMIFGSACSGLRTSVRVHAEKSGFAFSDVSVTASGDAWAGTVWQSAANAKEQDNKTTKSLKVLPEKQPGTNIVPTSRG